MYYLQQIYQVMFDPEYTTVGLYDTPRLGDAFIVVCLYAFFTAVDSFLSGYLPSDTFSVGLIMAFVSTLTTFLLWVGLAMAFHIAAEVLGGLGELPNAFSFVGLGMAPLIFTSILKIVSTVLHFKVFYSDTEIPFPMIGLGLTLLGMAWGTPGVICYFGMKNAEKVHMLKALGVTLLLFLAVAAGLFWFSGAFSG